MPMRLEARTLRAAETGLSVRGAVTRLGGQSLLGRPAVAASVGLWGRGAESGLSRRLETTGSRSRRSGSGRRGRCGGSAEALGGHGHLIDRHRPAERVHALTAAESRLGRSRRRSSDASRSGCRGRASRARRRAGGMLEARRRDADHRPLEGLLRGGCRRCGARRRCRRRRALELGGRAHHHRALEFRSTAALGESKTTARAGRCGFLVFRAAVRTEQGSPPPNISGPVFGCREAARAYTRSPGSLKRRRMQRMQMGLPPPT